MGTVIGRGRYARSTYPGRSNAVPSATSSQPSIASLEGLDTTSMLEGTTVYVATVRDYFGLERASTLTADGITVVAPSNGPGRWIRKMIADLSWSLQDTWYIDPASGNDENDGASVASAIQHHAELERRWGPEALLEQNTVVNILSDLDPVVDAQPRVVLTMAPSTMLRYKGVPKLVASGTLSAAVTSDPATNFQQTVTDPSADFSTLIGERIRLSNEAVSWIAAVVGSNDTARTGDFIITDTTQGSQGTTYYAPNGTESYSIETLPSVNNLYPEVRRDANAYNGSDWALVIEDIRIDALTWRFRDGGARPNCVNCRVEAVFIYGYGSTMLFSSCSGTISAVRRCTLETAGGVYFGGMNVGVGCLLGIGALHGGASATLWHNIAGGSGYSLRVNFGGEVAGFISGRISAFNEQGGGIGVRVDPQGTINGCQRIYGVSTSTGLFISRGGQVYWAGAANKPTVTGGVQDIVMISAAWTWADTPAAFVWGGLIDSNAANPHEFFMQGKGTLVNGQAIIGPTGDNARIRILSTSSIQVTKSTPSGATQGSLAVTARTTGSFGVAKFTVQALDSTGSVVAADTSDFDWTIVE